MTDIAKARQDVEDASKALESAKSKHAKVEEELCDEKRIEALKKLSISSMCKMIRKVEDFGQTTLDQSLWDAWKEVFQSDRKEEARTVFDGMMATINKEVSKNTENDKGGNENTGEITGEITGENTRDDTDIKDDKEETEKQTDKKKKRDDDERDGEDNKKTKT